jgi:hypothetical protein
MHSPRLRRRRAASTATLRLRGTRRGPAATLAAAAGGALGLAGIMEAVRLAKGDQATLRRSARTTGPIRAVAGSLLLVQPRLLPRALGAGSGAQPPDWLVRMVAVREIVLGISLSSARRLPGDPRPWLLSAAAIDGAEGVVVLDAIARRQLPGVPALGFAAADLGGALVAVGVLAQQRRDRARGSPATEAADPAAFASSRPEEPS